MVAAVLVFLTSRQAGAGEIDLTSMHEELSPIRLLAGSGLSGRSLATADGAHRLRLASLSVHLGDRVSLRAGVGAATHAIEPFLDAPAELGIALAGALRFTLLRRSQLAIDVSLTTAHAGYSGHALTDATALVVLRLL